MWLNRITLDPRCPEARRDLSDPYELHSTLCRAFCPPESRCPQGEFLWRLEPELGPKGFPRVLIQSRSMPDWSGIAKKGWLADIDPPIDLVNRLPPAALIAGRSLRFRLRANPCVTRAGKRLGLLKREQQEAWLESKGKSHGFSVTVPAGNGKPHYGVVISQECMLRGKRRSGDDIRLFSALYDGILVVTESQVFLEALHKGIGHGKALGLGLLSIAPSHN